MYNCIFNIIIIKIIPHQFNGLYFSPLISFLSSYISFILIIITFFITVFDDDSDKTAFLYFIIIILEKLSKCLLACFASWHFHFIKHATWQIVCENTFIMYVLPSQKGVFSKSIFSLNSYTPMLPRLSTFVPCLLAM